MPSLQKASEDCLFLDIYVPKKAIDNPSLKLPVISWFYGGAYIFGAKDQAEPILPFYDGTGLLQQSGSNAIFVASNYRVRLSLLSPSRCAKFPLSFAFPIAGCLHRSCNERTSIHQGSDAALAIEADIYTRWALTASSPAPQWKKQVFQTQAYTISAPRSSGSKTILASLAVIKAK